jgi:hypothetical protein
LAVKGRLHETTLPQVEFPLAREQPFAKEHLRALEHVPFHEGALVRDEHVAHLIGVGEEMYPEVPDLRPGDIPLLALQPEKETGEISARSQDVRERGE